MRFILSTIAALALAGSAQASVLFSDDFEAEPAALTVTSLTNWTVTGNVDVVGMPNPYGITCAGNCVDLDGTTGPGTIVSKEIAFAAGRMVTISYDLSGSQRASAADDFLFAVSFGVFPYIDTAGRSWVQPGGDVGANGPEITLSGQGFSSSLPGGAPWGTFTYNFLPTTSGAMTLKFLTTSADNVGPLLDNVLVTQAGVPEPATWAMLIAGFGLVGFAARRRRAVAA